MVNKQDRAPEERGAPEPRRAGLRPDERDPNSPPGEPGSAGGGIHAAGTALGGTSVGGLGGTNVGNGSIDDVDLENPFGSGVLDQPGDTEDGGPPYSGKSGGAVGGTPAEKRAEGGRTHRGIAPGTTHRGDSTIGSDPHRKTED